MFRTKIADPIPTFKNAFSILNDQDGDIRRVIGLKVFETPASIFAVMSLSAAKEKLEIHPDNSNQQNQFRSQHCEVPIAKPANDCRRTRFISYLTRSVTDNLVSRLRLHAGHFPPPQPAPTNPRAFESGATRGLKEWFFIVACDSPSPYPAPLARRTSFVRFTLPAPDTCDAAAQSTLPARETLFSRRREVHDNWVPDGQTVSFLSLYIDDRTLDRAICEVTDVRTASPTCRARSADDKRLKQQFLRMYFAMEARTSRLEAEGHFSSWLNSFWARRRHGRASVYQSGKRTRATHAGLHRRTFHGVDFVGGTRSDRRFKSLPLCIVSFAASGYATARLSNASADQSRPKSFFARAVRLQTSRPRPDSPRPEPLHTATSGGSLGCLPAVIQRISSPNRKNVQDTKLLLSETTFSWHDARCSWGKSMTFREDLCASIIVAFAVSIFFRSHYSCPCRYDLYQRPHCHQAGRQQLVKSGIPTLPDTFPQGQHNRHHR